MRHKRAFLFPGLLVLSLLLCSADRGVADGLSVLRAFATDGQWPNGGLVLSGDTFYGTTKYGGALNDGMVYSIKTDGSGFADLYEFSDGGDGLQPNGNLLLSGGTLYGTTIGDGITSFGTVFSIGTNGSSFASLYTFSEVDPVSETNEDGASPNAGLVLSGNTLYGTSFNGGINGCGALFAINTDGSDFTNFYNFSALDTNAWTNFDGANPDGGLVLAGGTLYGSADVGGTNGNGTIFAVNTDGSGFNTLYTFSQLTFGNLGTNSDGAYPVGSLTLSGNTLYGSASYGGPARAGTIFSLQTDGSQFTTLYSFSATSGTNSANDDGQAPNGDLVLSGNLLYGTALEGGLTGNGTVFAVDTTNGDLINLYNFTNGVDGNLPDSSVTLAGGILYGEAINGGVANGGTLFAISLNPAPAPPSLQISRSGNQVMLSWPIAAGNFGLQTTSDFGNGGWSLITTGITTNGANVVYQTPASGHSAFFRLESR